MTVAIKPIPCDGLCASCYEAPVRSHTREPFDAAAVLARVDRMIEEHKANPDVHKDRPTIHGGEPLLIPPAELELLLQRIHGAWGTTAVQTNAIRLDASHIEMFKRYQTAVGVSLDGDTGSLNRGRWNRPPATPDLAEKMTRKTLEKIEALTKAGVPVSIIAVLRKYNAGPGRLIEFEKFALRLGAEFGIHSIRMNEAIVQDPSRREEEELTPEELSLAFLNLAGLCLADPERTWLPFRDIVDLLTGHENGTCVFNGCDPWKTGGEQTIMADGSTGGCLKTGAGPDGLQAPQPRLYGRERDSLLAILPEAHQGCQACRYWPICRGGCPGTGAAGDWRNKTRFCPAYKALFSWTEGRIRGLLPNFQSPLDMKTPSSAAALFSISGSTWQAKDRKTAEEIERAHLAAPAAEKRQNRPHGDHWDSARGKK